MRRKGIGAVAVGACLLIAAVVGFVVVPEHKPGSKIVARSGPTLELTCAGPLNGGIPPNCVESGTGLSRTLYNALKVATWALVIVGVLLVAMGLIRYARPEVGR